MTEQNKLPPLPEEQRSFAGFPEYEELLARDCPYIGKPCIREKCKKWTVVRMPLPNKLAPTQMDVYILHQCQDDGIHFASVAAANMLGQMMMNAQIAAQQRLIRSGGERGGFGLPFGNPAM